MKLDEVMRVLQAIALFRRVEPEALRVLAFSAVRRPMRAGDVLFRKGETADGGYLVLSGAIVLDPDDDGAPSRHVYRRGTLIGQTALFAPVERPATAIAREETMVLMFGRDLVAKVLDAYPETAAVLHEAMTEASAKLERRIARVAL